MNTNEDLKSLIESFDELSQKSQCDEINTKIKSLIGLFNELNIDKNLLLSPTDDKSDMSTIFGLLCTLENEIGKYLDEKIS